MTRTLRQSFRSSAGSRKIIGSSGSKRTTDHFDRLALLAMLMTIAAWLAPPAYGRSEPSRRGPLASAAGAAQSSQVNLEALPEVAQPVVSATLGRDDRSYHVSCTGGEPRLINRAQSLKARFTAHGMNIRADEAHWNLALRGYGYGARPEPVAVVTPHGDANRVEYRRGALTEWYVNGPLGLEQGFTLAREPGNRNGEPLMIDFAMSGELTATIDRSGRSLTLSSHGRPALRYGGLTATDAHGRELPAWLEVADNHLRLLVDDAAARYPISVDPLLQAATLTASDGVAADQLGYAVSMSGDGSTIAVGARGPFVGQTHPGAAYVFVRSANGWNDTTEKAKLTGSDSVAGDDFGNSVAISRDASVVVVSAASAMIGGNEDQGAIYVFERPAGGWASSNELTKLTVSDGMANDFFGAGVAVSDNGSTIVAGLIGESDGAYFHGAAYVFQRALTSIGWGPYQERATLSNSDPFYDGSDTCQTLCGDDFGSPVAISGDGATIGVGAAAFPGAVYVYVRPDTGWASANETAKVTSSDAAGQFGTDLSFSQDAGTLAVGTLQAPYPRGAVYVFLKPDTGWASTSTHTAKLTASDNPNFLGISTRISGDGKTIAAVAFSLANSVHIYPKPDTGWADATETVQLPGDYHAHVDLSNDGMTLVVGRPELGNQFAGAAIVYTGSTGSDFTLGPVSPLNITIGGSGSSAVAVNSYNGFNSAVSLTSTGAPSGATATLNPASVTPPSGGSLSSQLTVTAGPSVAAGSFQLAIQGTSGTLTHSTPVTVTVAATPGGVTQVISTVTALGCIDNSGIANALTMKLANAQASIAAGDTKSAINTLTALLHELNAQAGKHIKTTCTDANGNTFNPVQVLIADVQALLTSLGAASIKPNPIMGNAVTTSGVGVAAATVSLVNSAKTTIASTTTDATGFYFFAKTSVLTSGTTYTVMVKPPKLYKSATSPSFKWTATVVMADSIVR
jgi:hypothetical protein